MVSQIVYTNSKCSDVWDMFIAQNRKHCNFDLYFISDIPIPNFPQEKVFIYKNEDLYYKVWIDALNKFKLDTFIYLQEDFVLYDNVDSNAINKYNYYIKQSDYSFVRLLKCGNLNNNKIYDTLYEIESLNADIFAMQATIWKTSDFIKLYDYSKPSNWRDEPLCGSGMRALQMRGLYHYNEERKIGLNHYDSKIYPYIATALVMGKWNIFEYSELDGILNTYNIDKKKRGLYAR